ncbi:MAG TPA: HDIG domain-containing protein [Spirochaetota bacterium]|nr:HDIG domain-containing protein [Spirochaetota bacterium]
MKYTKNISFQNFFRIFKDKKIRFYYIFIILLILLSTGILAYKVTDKTYSYNVGDIAETDIRVQRDIHFVKDIETESQKNIAIQSEKLVFDKDTSVLEDNIKSADILFSAVIKTIEESIPAGAADLDSQLVTLKKRLPKSQYYSDEILLSLLLYDNPRQLKNSVTKILIYIYDYKGLGVLDYEYTNPLKLDMKAVTIRSGDSPDAAEEVPAVLDDLVTVDNVRLRLYNICYSVAPFLPQETLLAVSAVIKNYLKPNLSFNSEETLRRIDEKLKEIKPVTGLLKKGQTIIREGDTVTNDAIQKIAIINKYAKTSHVNFIMGLILLQIIFVALLSFFTFSYELYYFPDRKGIIVICSLILFFMIYAFFVENFEMAETSKVSYILLMPIPFITMMISILYNIYLSLFVALYIVFFALMIVGIDTQSVFLAFSSAVMGTFINLHVDKRSDFFKGGLILGVINSIIIVAIALIENTPWKIVFTNSELAVASGILNSILALGIFPIYEHFFDITTKFKLLELSDLNADIFKKMLLNAPGTYNHSLVVSTLAEAACKEIDANYMLARVGAFYHDIGKINDPGIYIENGISDIRAKRMTPTEYSRLIISHVSKGVVMAKKHGLPESVIDFIKEHHGTSTMTFFYHQALENASGSTSTIVNRSDFQYPGPQPHSKESAVVMLADSIEAASRSIKDPTKEKIEGMVRKIIYNKLNDGDLDDSGLSMVELKVVQNVFLRMLLGIFHTRIEYPDSERIKDLEKEAQEVKHV